ncbi:MAG TPA: Nif11-like leader peptide family natural product precursor [Actinoplanes sp.]|nr:Nif11-like leader peptide family natural product precursor [Actinoplanes sp.]
MSRQSVLAFLRAARDDRALCARYTARDLTQLVFHARNEGFDFTADELADVVGALEANVILAKDGEQFGAGSGLWRRMWGERHLTYLIESVVRRHGDDELDAVAAGPGRLVDSR